MVTCRDAANPNSAAGEPAGPLMSWISRSGPLSLIAEPARPAIRQKGREYRATNLVVDPIHTGSAAAIACNLSGSAGRIWIEETASAGVTAMTTCRARKSRSLHRTVISGPVASMISTGWARRSAPYGSCAAIASARDWAPWLNRPAGRSAGLSGSRRITRPVSYRADPARYCSWVGMLSSEMSRRTGSSVSQNQVAPRSRAPPSRVLKESSRPPTRSRASKMMTSRPEAVSRRAALSPEMPAPMTMTSVSVPVIRDSPRQGRRMTE